MPEFKPADLTVIIPTRDRWPILARTLEGLRRQSCRGFRTLVVVDGTDQEVPAVDADLVIQQDRSGPGAARNRAVATADTRLVLFLGDDILPDVDLIQQHLAAHEAEPASEVAVLGYTTWHGEVSRSVHNQWLEWSSSQFDFRGIVGDDAGWGRFYSSNVSLKRNFFVRAGGFDEDFKFDYEDLDLAYRLHLGGLHLRFRKQARGAHLHLYDWPALVRRYHSRGQAERQMAEKHEWFEPAFRARIEAAGKHSPASAMWPALASRLERAGLSTRATGMADRWYHQQLMAPFFGGWNGGDDLADLKEYLGDQFDPTSLQNHQMLVDEEERAAGNELTFYRTSNAYLYDLTMFAVWGTKEPYLNVVRTLVPPGSSILDYGCGIGSDGLRLIGSGYQVAFTDFDNPSTKYLRWRLSRRGLDAPVYDVEGHVPGEFDLAYSFDVIEHVDDPIGFLAELEARARIVVVNFLEPDPDDTHLHHALPIRTLLRHATRKGLLFYERFSGRSHLVAYRTSGSSLKQVVDSLGRRWNGAVHIAMERATGIPRGHSGQRFGS